MDKFDFDLYKKQTDEIDLTDKQKQDLISNILDKEKRENLKVIDFPTEKPKIYKYKNLLTIAAGFVIIISIAFLTNLVPGFLSSQKMDDFSLVNSLSQVKTEKYRVNHLTYNLRVNIFQKLMFIQPVIIILF